MRLLLAAALLSLAGGHAAANGRRAACPPGEFAFDAHDEVRIARAFPGIAMGSIVLAGPRTVALGSCEGVGTSAAKRHATVVAARFAACGGVHKVRLRGRIAAPSCTTLVGTIRGRHLGAIPFSAHRVATSTTTTLPSVTTTTLGPQGARCGNGIVDPGEACDGAGSCPQDQQCDGTCTCVALPRRPVFAQTLIAQALAAGRIDYPTSLLYRGWALVEDPALPDEFVGDVAFGEDGDLGVEIDALLADPSVTLPADMTAALRAFSVRPTDPASYFSTHPAVPATALLTSRPLAAIAQQASGSGTPCPTNPDTGKPDWRPFETANFVIWSCGGGAPDQDVTGAQRLSAGAMAEEIWQTMVPDTGPPLGDSWPEGPAPQRRIDVYLVDTGNAECDPRSLVCDTLAKDNLAFAQPAADCTTLNGPVQSSGYIVARINNVPATAPDASTPTKFRATLAHEFFHLVEFASNLAPVGKKCGSPPIGKTVVPSGQDRSWLVEASAEWAAHAYFHDDNEELWNQHFEWFQFARRSLTDGDDMLTLLSNGFEKGGDSDWALRPYEAFLYLLFWEQQSGGRSAIIDLWRQSGGVSTPQDLTNLLDVRYRFFDHLRDFHVRNLNEDLTGDPIDPLWKDVDGAITSTKTPQYFRDTAKIDAPLEKLDWPTGIDPAAALYENYELDKDIRYLKLDFSGIDGAGDVALDIVAHEAGDDSTYWVRRKFGGAIVEICRDEQGWDYDTFRLVVTNSRHEKDATITDPYKVTARPTCPEEWSGSIVYTLAIDSSGPGGERHEHDRERWTVGATSEVPIFPGGPVIEQVDLVWSANYDYSAYQGGMCPATWTRTGTGHDTTHAAVTVTPDGVLYLSQIDLPSTYDVTATYADCGTETTVTTTSGDAFNIALSGAGGKFDPAPSDPNSFSGHGTIIHDDETDPDGTETITDVTVDWNLQRIIPKPPSQ